MPIESQQNVVQLEISVDDALRVEVLEGEENLAGVELGLAEGELLLLDMKHQISSRDVFHDKVHSGLCLETRVQAKQEGVSFLRRGQKDAFLGLGTKRQSRPRASS